MLSPMSVDRRRTGVLLIQLGTPSSPAVSDVRRYLREFLGDRRVLDMPRLPHWLLLHLVILPFRPRKSARAYASIWTRDGSPLLLHSRGLAEAVAKQLGDGFTVELGMRYGEPSVREALLRLARADLDRLIALPLFPQHADSSTGSALAHFSRAGRRDLARARALDDRSLLRPSGLHRLGGRAGAYSTPRVPARSRPLQLPRIA